MLATPKVQTTVFIQQIFNLSDYTVSPPDMNGRRVEKWEQLEVDDTDENKLESEIALFNYISPEAFIVAEDWYKICGV